MIQKFKITKFIKNLVVIVTLVLLAIWSKHSRQELIASEFYEYEIEIVCKNDATVLFENDKYCRSCGKESINIASLLTKDRICKNCEEKQIRKDSDYCFNCGEIIDTNKYVFKEHGYETMDQVHDAMNLYVLNRLNVSTASTFATIVSVIVMLLAFREIIERFFDCLEKKYNKR